MITDFNLQILIEPLLNWFAGHARVLPWREEPTLFRGLSECPANRNIIFRLYRFSFHKPIRSRLARGRLYLPFTIYKSTTESATLRPLNSGLQHAFTDTVAQSTIAFLL